MVRTGALKRRNENLGEKGIMRRAQRANTPVHRRPRTRAAALATTLWLCAFGLNVSDGELGRNYHGQEGATRDTPVARSRRLKRSQPLEKSL